MQKSPEDNQATGQFTCVNFTTQNPKFIKICHQMKELDKMNEKEIKKELAVKRISIRYSLYV